MCTRGWPSDAPKVGQEIGRVWPGYCRDRLLSDFRGPVSSIYIEKLGVLRLGGAVCTLVSEHNFFFKGWRAKGFLFKGGPGGGLTLGGGSRVGAYAVSSKLEVHAPPGVEAVESTSISTCDTGTAADIFRDANWDNSALCIQKKRISIRHLQNQRDDTVSDPSSSPTSE